MGLHHCVLSQVADPHHEAELTVPRGNAGHLGESQALVLVEGKQREGEEEREIRHTLEKARLAARFTGLEKRAYMTPLVEGKQRKGRERRPT
jgi:hypothetical protein